MAADMSGPSLPFAYLAAAILMLPAILSMSELSAAMPRSAGPPSGRQKRKAGQNPARRHEALEKSRQVQNFYCPYFIK